MTAHSAKPRGFLRRHIFTTRPRSLGILYLLLGLTAVTVGTLLSILMFHQAGHTGQTTVLRRIAGKQGAIR